MDKFFPIRYLKRFEGFYDDLPNLYIVTPTFPRFTQYADLARITNTLRLVPKVFWIVIEDTKKKTEKLSKFLTDSGIKFAHLNVKSPPYGPKLYRKIHKGVLQRNYALKWIRDNNLQNGVLFFADDDNSYDLQLFEEVYFLVLNNYYFIL